VSNGYVTATGEGILLNLRVSPGAKRSSVDGPYGACAFKLRVAAPPTHGRANAEVERFLADLLGTPRSNVTVVRGSASRDKTVLVRGIDGDKVHKLLSPHLS